jgi:predicted transcriptional regulator of viral defense system
LGAQSTGAETQLAKLVSLVRDRGICRSRDLASVGVHRRYLAIACGQGLIKRVARGLYAPAGSERGRRQELLQACRRVPRGILCLSSALYFHGFLHQEPSQIWMAIGHKARLPRVDALPLKIIRFSGEALTLGVVNLKVDGVPVRVYSPMKTIADCFKFRHQIGIDIAVAALRASVHQAKYSRYRLLHFARICRVEKLIRMQLPSRRKRMPKAN